MPIVNTAKAKRSVAPEKRNLAKNTLMLYVLMFSSYLFSFITVPHQTRILGAEIFGMLGFAAAIMLFVQLLIDFGFILHATDLVSRNRENKKYVSEVYSAVMLIKLTLVICLFMVFIVAYAAIPGVADNWLLFLLYFLSTVFLAGMPDFIYRGMEDMKPVTVRTVAVRAFFAVMIFIFLREPEQYLIVPLLLLIGNATALFIVLKDIKSRFDIRLTAVPLGLAKRIFKESSMYFYSRVASQVFRGGSTVALGLVGSSASLGYFVASNRLVTAARGGIGPIGDSLYPYMMRRKDFSLIRRVLLVGVPILAIGCTVVFIFAEQVCVILFGEEFAPAAPILQILLPLVVLALPQYLLGFPTLGAMGLAKQANMSILVASLLQVSMLAGLFVSGNITAITVATTMLISEMVTLAYRVCVIYRYRARLTSS